MVTIDKDSQVEKGIFTLIQYFYGRKEENATKLIQITKHT